MWLWPRKGSPPWQCPGCGIPSPGDELCAITISSSLLAEDFSVCLLSPIYPIHGLIFATLSNVYVVVSQVVFLKHVFMVDCFGFFSNGNKRACLEVLLIKKSPPHFICPCLCTDCMNVGQLKTTLHALVRSDSEQLKPQ